jgi:hypothetical protein
MRQRNLTVKLTTTTIFVTQNNRQISSLHLDQNERDNINTINCTLLQLALKQANSLSTMMIMISFTTNS